MGRGIIRGPANGMNAIAQLAMGGCRRSVWEKLIDRARAVAYIRYHINFRACLRAWFVARLESAMETSGQDSFGADAFSVGVIVSGIEPVER